MESETETPRVTAAKEIWDELKNVHESASDSGDDSFVNDGDPFDDFGSDESPDHDGSPPRKRRVVVLSDTESPGLTKITSLG
mgnify:CR=1 FL=1